MNSIEETLGPEYVTFNSPHNAVQACVEMLGARSHMIVAILPITTEPDILSGVMRGGAHPLLLDTDETGIFYNPERLQEALEELEGGAVVFLPRTALEREPEAIGELLEGVPTVSLNQHTPGGRVWGEQVATDFELYYLEPWIGCGAVIRTRYSEQLEDLKQIRSAVLGLNAQLPSRLDRMAAEMVEDRTRRSVTVARKPLHLVPEIASRWDDTPSYPNAEAYWAKVMGSYVESIEEKFDRDLTQIVKSFEVDIQERNTDDQEG